MRSRPVMAMWWLVVAWMAFTAVATAGQTPDSSPQTPSPANAEAEPQGDPKSLPADRRGRLTPEQRERMREWLAESGRDRTQSALPQTIDPAASKLYKLQAGSHAIHGVETYILRDPKRGKDIPLRLTFPAEAPPAGQGYPLLVFCHGALGSKDGYQVLVRHWASHGYVVIAPTFGDSISLMTPEERASVRSLIDLVNSPQVSREWNRRPQDVKHVLDSLDQIERDVEGLAGKIDRTKIAVGGHSYGAHTSMLIAGLKLTAPRGGLSQTFTDPRVAATFMISPQGTGGAVRPESFAAMTRPVLMITGDHDGSPIRGQEQKKGQWRREAFDHALPGDRYLLWIKDAHHGFGGIAGAQAWPGAGPAAPDHVRLVQSTCLAFLDAFLKQDAQALAYLRGNAVREETRGAAWVENKVDPATDR